jgi:hypothetical protein
LGETTQPLSGMTWGIARSTRRYSTLAMPTILAWECQNDAIEIKLRAERKLSQLTQEMEKSKGTRSQLSGGNIVIPPGDTPTYAELGLDKVQVHRWQQAAELPEPESEQHLTQEMEKQHGARPPDTEYHRDTPSAYLSTAWARPGRAGPVIPSDGGPRSCGKSPSRHHVASSQYL